MASPLLPARHLTGPRDGTRAGSAQFLNPLIAAAAVTFSSLPEGHRLHWSQIHGLGANVVVPGLEGAPSDDIHSDAQQVLQILEQTDVIKKGGAWLEINEQI